MNNRFLINDDGTVTLEYHNLDTLNLMAIGRKLLDYGQRQIDEGTATGILANPETSPVHAARVSESTPTAYEVFSDSLVLDPDIYMSSEKGTKPVAWQGIKFRTVNGKGTKPVYIAEENVGEFVFALQEVPDNWKSFASSSYGGVLARVLHPKFEGDGEPLVRVTSTNYFESGKGRSARFDVPVSQWREFKTQAINHLIGIYY
jgi:hypothetical protein